MNWELVAQDAMVRAEDEEALRNGMVSLSCWPDLNQVPQPMQSLVARVCALLGHRPSAGILIPTILALPRQEVFSALAVLARLGHVKVTAKPTSESRAVSSAEVAKAASPEEAMTPRSVATKLWSKLQSLRGSAITPPR